MGQAQVQPKQPEIDQKRAREKKEGKTLFEWSNDLHEKDISIQVRAISMLKYYGSAARREVPVILKAMSHRDTSMRVNATITLGFVGVDPANADAAIKRLAELLYDPQHIIRYQAAVTLTRLGSGVERINAFAATAALVNALHQENSSYEVRAAAALAIGWVAWTDKGFDRPAWQALLRSTSMSEPSADVRMSSVLALILFGRPSRPDDLKVEEKWLMAVTTEKQNKRVAPWAFVCLMRILDQISDGHLRGISRYLKDSDASVRANAARALATVGPSAASQVPALQVLLTMDEDPSVLIWVAAALGSIGNLAKEAAPDLEKLKAHKDQAVRDAVNVALEKIQEKVRMDDPTPEKKKKK